MVNNMEIRKLDSTNIKEIEEVVELWYEVSVKAHSFISPSYWEKNKEAMCNLYIPKSETYLATKKGKIVGFISMADNYLAAIFIKINMQGMGIGKKLLKYIKEKENIIQLRVYKKNTDSVEFYKRQGFEMIKESSEKDTGELELLMEWVKDKERR